MQVQHEDIRVELIHQSQRSLSILGFSDDVDARIAAAICLVPSCTSA